MERSSFPKLGAGKALLMVSSCGAVLVGMLCLKAAAAGDASDSKSGDDAWKKQGSASQDEAVQLVDYPGVDPEKQTGVAPLISNAKKSALTVVTWPGFQMVDGGSRVFVQLLKGKNQSAVEAPTRSMKVPFKVDSPSIVYSFSKKVVLVKNNLNPLVTRSFNTPVDEVRMLRKKGTVYMVLSLRTAVEPVREEMVETADGYHFFFVEFASGNYLASQDEEEQAVGGKTVIE